MFCSEHCRTLVRTMYKPTEKSLYLFRIALGLVFFATALISFRFARNASHLLSQSQHSIPLTLATSKSLTASVANKQQLQRSVVRSHPSIDANVEKTRKNKKKSALDFWVIDHLKWHDAQLDNVASARILVWRARRSAGIGDQIRAMMAAYQYAVLSRRVLRIDWTFPHPLSLLMSDSARKRFVYNGGVDEIREALRRQPKWRYEFRGTGLSREMFDYLNSDANTVILSIGPSVQTGNDAVQGLRPNDTTIPRWTPVSARAAIRKVLEPSRELAALVEEAQRELGLCSTNSRCRSGRNNYISVHARLGVGTNESRLERFAGMETKLTSTARCFALAVKRYARVSPMVVFVASDTSSWPAIFETEMKKIMPSARVVFVDDEPMHIHSISPSEGRTVFLRQHMENLLIGGAQHTIALRSGFPEVGFWRGTGIYYTMLRKMPCAQGNPHIRLNGTWWNEW